jgi:arylsulfatase A
MKLTHYFFLFLLFANGSFAQNNKPNIIFVLADDLGIDGVSAYGADFFKTPVIDKLAKEGIRYTNAYTVPLCGPSRALILSGRYGFRTGAVNQDMTGEIKPSAENFMPSILKKAGYATSMIGKWGQLPLDPGAFGFDDYLRFFGSGSYVNEAGKKDKYVVNGKEAVLKDGEYMPDLMHDHMVNFLAKHKKDPFYLYYSLSHVHGEIVATPDTKPGTSDYKDLYADNISYMDKLVGKLVHTLDSLQLRENTLIVFFGDNGTAGQAAVIGRVQGQKLSGKKGTMQECGSLVPMIVNWPGMIKKPGVSNSLIDAADFVPTFAELAGAPLPTNNVLDGVSFAYQLKGGKGTAREWIFTGLGKDWYVRSANWKLMRSGDLYDMRKAPFEEKLVVLDDKTTIEKQKLQAVLDKLNPAGGFLDNGDGSGRHANKTKNKEKKN